MDAPAHRQELRPCKCSGAKTARSLEQASGLPDVVKTFEQFKAHLVTGGERAYMAVTGFGREEVGEFFLTIIGNNGTGKTHLLQAMAREVLDNGFLVRYLYAPVFLDQLRQTFNKHQGDEATFDQVFQQYKSPYLLVIDDLARGHYSDWGVAQMELLIEHRYRNHMKTAFASNFSDTEMVAKLGSMIVDRVFDAGSGAALVAHVGGPSFRTGRVIPARR
jgi:DNA replication protein DnaC